MARSLIKNKSGIFLTFIALSLMAAFTLLFTPSTIFLDTEGKVTKSRVASVNDYVENLEDVYVDTSVQAAGTKAIFTLQNYMTSQNSFLTDFETDFLEVLQNGTIAGVPQVIMNDNTFSLYMNRVFNVTQNSFGITSSYNLLGMAVYQVEPWNFRVETNISLLVASETATWDKNITVRTDIPVTWFEDPLYALNTQNNVRNWINKTPTISTGWNLSNFEEHIIHGTYVHFEDSKAPNFIMRFTNNTDQSACCGIESVVNPNDFDDSGDANADYLYFNHTYQSDCGNLFNMTQFYGAYEHLQFPTEHIFLYNLSQTTFEPACP